MNLLIRNTTRNPFRRQHFSLLHYFSGEESFKGVTFPVIRQRFSSKSSVATSQSSSASANNTEINNEPINYFGSKAETWKAATGRSGGQNHKEETLWYQPLVISLSMGIFLIYFCVLREENDIDLKFDKQLYDHVDGMEVSLLKTSYLYNKRNGLPVDDIEKRLLELNINVEEIKE